MTWNIHTKKINSPKAKIVFLGDLHIGAQTTDIEALKQAIAEIARQKNTRIVLTGDLIELALKPHMTREQTIPPHLQIPTLIEILRPVLNRIDFIVEGNHEKRVTRLASVDYLADALLPHCKNAVFLGYEGFVEYELSTGKKHLLYVHHGEGKSMTTQFLLDKAIEKAGLDVADAVIIAHGHKRDVREYVRWMKIGDTIVQRMVLGIRTGSFMGHAQYAKNSMFTGGKIGYVSLELTETIGAIW